ncbi:hypothetical protein [Piscinibacter sp.]|uniref:hypothetical protein n=1 Tax=Piscinibacter sp. TaxID=1903157 RepID=UPI002B728471|nr:hypothetical protein [Albitalea sp.]HUG22061.1 hypothetical protein [Albitalea sp.]
MKLYAITAWGAMALAAPLAFAQTQPAADPALVIPQTQTQPQVQVQPGATPQPVAVPQTPEPIVIETTVDLTTEPGPPADPQAAREEAINALDWAKREGCRSETARESQRECIQRAQDEYKRAMAELSRHPGGR